MSANVDGMIRAAVDAFKRGNRTEARTLLEKATELDQMNEQAWLWLGAVVQDPVEQQTCLENVLVINPNNERAKQGLKSLGVDVDRLQQQQAKTRVDDDELPMAAPFTDVTFTDDDDFSFLDDEPSQPATPPPSQEVTIPTSSASATFDDSMTSNDYDSWMDNLNLPGTQQEEQFTENNMFGFDDTTDFDSTTGFEEVSQEPTSFYGSDDYGTMFGDADDDIAADNALDDDPTYGFADYASADVNEFNEVLGQGYDDDDDGLFDPYGDDDPITGADDSYDDYVDAGGAQADFDDIFRMIPVSVKPTSIPGKQAGRSPVKLLLTVLLVIGNLAAVGVLVMQLIS